MKRNFKRFTVKFTSALLIAATLMGTATTAVRADEINTQLIECVESVVEGQGDVIDDCFAEVDGQGDVIDDQFALAPEDEAQPAEETVVVEDTTVDAAAPGVADTTEAGEAKAEVVEERGDIIEEEPADEVTDEASADKATDETSVDKESEVEKKEEQVSVPEEDDDDEVVLYSYMGQNGLGGGTTSKTPVVETQRVNTKEASNEQNIEEQKPEVEKTREEKIAEEREEEKLIASSGTIAKKLIADITGIDVTDPQRAIEEIAKKTFQKFNNEFISSIPYVGNILKNLINQIADIDDEASSTETKSNEDMKEISDKLTEINKSIIRGTDKILDDREKSERSRQLDEVENSAKTLMDFYLRDNIKFRNAMINLSGPEEDKAYQNADEVFANIYSSDRDTNDYYDAYMNFVDRTLNNNTLVPNPRKYDVFGNYDKLLSEGQTDLSRYKYNDERKDLSDRVNNVIGDGYSILRMTMETDLAKHQNMMSSYEAQRVALRGQLVDADAETTAMINSQISDLNNDIERCRNCISVTEAKIKKLNEVKDKANSCIDNQEKDIAEGDKFNAKEDIQKTYTINNMRFDSTRVGKDQVMTQPEFNKDENRVDFKDRYGNVIGYRKFNTLKKIDKDQMKEGHFYKVEHSVKTGNYEFMGLLFPKYKTVTSYVYVTDSREDDKWGILTFIMGKEVTIHCYNTGSDDDRYAERLIKGDIKNVWEITASDMVLV